MLNLQFQVNLEANNSYSITDTRELLGKEETLLLLEELSSPLNLSNGTVGIILAAGHGKRIKSEKSKMLHEIWGVPTVLRVRQALEQGLGKSSQLIVVGVKAEEVARSVGKKENLKFVFQEEQIGTGDAVCIAMNNLEESEVDYDVFIVPGDMGLIDGDTISGFKDSFKNSNADMTVLTGQYAGNPENNQYGRIIRVPKKLSDGSSAGSLEGEIVEIIEHKDILAMSFDEPFELNHKDKKFHLTKEELINISEFNTGLFGFKAKVLNRYLRKITTDNVQGELYVTDLIKIFNENKLIVRAANATDSKLVEGFNVKSTLREMEAIARERVYEKLKDVITIKDRKDFFIADEVVEHILDLDSSGNSGDLLIHKGVYLGPDVHLSAGVEICDNCHLTGEVHLGRNVHISERVVMSSYPGQVIKIGDGTTVLNGNELKGRISIGTDCLIESRVYITGSDEYPINIGNEVHLRGVSYIFGSVIESGVKITHSVIKRKHVKYISSKEQDGEVVKLRYIIPKPEGEDAVKDL